jgi:hypothetical protein
MLQSLFSLFGPDLLHDTTAGTDSIFLVNKFPLNHQDRNIRKAQNLKGKGKGKGKYVVRDVSA